MTATIEAPPICRLAVVKVASRCNLNCSYCYVYNLGDKSYLRMPRVMSALTVQALMRRVAEHCRRHGLSEFDFVFHGGEPLLAKPPFFRKFVEAANAALPRKCTPAFFLQTNATLLTAPWCEVLKELDIRLGISLDGPQEVNDGARVDHRGRGSYARTRRGWDLAKSFGLDPGLLAVVDIQASPRMVFEHLKELKPRSVDFLLPDATHDKPPPCGARSSSETAYADWLLEMFALWIADDEAAFPIRLFERIVRLLLGVKGRLDAIGPGKNEVLVVETDGAIEAADVLKVCADGITRTPLNVHTNSLDDAFSDPLISLYYSSNDQLCGTCDKCRLKDVCGGGYLPHRYRHPGNFDNPSVYCLDLMKLIVGVQNWVVANLPADVASKVEVRPLSFNEVRRTIT